MLINFKQIMVDIIWGNGNAVFSSNSFILNVTHRKDGNKSEYKDQEKILIKSADIPGLSNSSDHWDEELLKNSVIGAFLKCEIESRGDDDVLIAKVSHSGVGGY